MSKLLRRAKIRYEHAKEDYKKVNEDDAYADYCCYNLQQGIEMTLKYLVEMSGQTYVENHDIRAQLNKLNRVGFEIPAEERLRVIASTVNSWETESRYKDDFVALNEDIKEAMEILEMLIEKAESLVEPVMIKPIDSFGE